MKMEKILITMLLLLIIGSCKNKENDMTVVDLVIDIRYINSEQVDLLNPSNTGSYNIDLMNLYHYKNGKKELFYMGNLDYPKGIYFFQYVNNDQYILRISQPNDYDDSRNKIEYETITLLELNANETDTISCLIEQGFNSYVCKRVKYNSRLVWSWEDQTQRMFTIEK